MFQPGEAWKCASEQWGGGGVGGEAGARQHRQDLGTGEGHREAASSEEILCKVGGRELALNDRLLPSASLSGSWVPPRVPYPGPCRMLSHNLRAAP